MKFFGSERSLFYYRFHIEHMILSFVILSVIVAKKECKIYITVMLDVNSLFLNFDKKTRFVFL